MTGLECRAKHRDEDCGQCDHAKHFGCWADTDVTHCRDCGFTWPLSQTRTQHCVQCHETFGGDEAATRHQNRDGSCRAPGSVLHRDGWAILVQGPDGVWKRAFGK